MDELCSLADKARERGERVILTNGCFEVLHVGHVRYLQGAKALGGFLVVALNGDSSVRRLKGEGRPLQPQEERAELLAALEPVDALTIFEEDDVTGILRTLRPDVHAKGSDYTPDTVPERNVAREVGAEVLIVGGPKVRSTRWIVDDLRE
jgi:rfaE bifunctional protein nucleotidyltransferase chain/domain